MAQLRLETALTGLRKLLADGQAVEDAVTHHFSNSGPGKGYADGANALATAIGTAAEGQNAATGLMKVLADGRAVESDQSKLASALSGSVDDVPAKPATSSATITGSLTAKDDSFKVTLTDENGITKDLTYNAVDAAPATSSAAITGSLAAKNDTFKVTLTDENGNTQDLTYTAVDAVAATSSATITGSLAAKNDTFTVTLTDENSNTQDLTYTAVGPVAATSSATISGSLAAKNDTFKVTLTAEGGATEELTYTAVDAVAATSSATITGSAAEGDTFKITLTAEGGATEVVTITAGTGGADAAAVVTALAAETASGYAFNANGDKLEVTRSDGVNFAISAAETTGSGNAASVKVDQSTDGSTAAAENTAADIVTGLAANSASGYTFNANGDKLEITRSDGVDFAISAGTKTGSGDAASVKVDQSTDGSTAAAENTAADIVTGLAANSASGYTFNANGDKLEITRSDGVDFAISAGTKTGSGDAASVKVDQSTDGSTAAAENTAADIVTGLAANSASGYTFNANGDKLEVTRSDGVDFAISAGAKTGSGNAASNAVAESSNGSIAAAENTAADIVTGLAANSVSGYTFNANGDKLEVTRSDGVDFAISVGAKKLALARRLLRRLLRRSQAHWLLKMTPLKSL